MIALDSEALGEVTALWTRIDKVYHIPATGTWFDQRDETGYLTCAILLHDIPHIYCGDKAFT